MVDDTARLARLFRGDHEDDLLLAADHVIALARRRSAVTLTVAGRDLVVALDDQPARRLAVALGARGQLRTMLARIGCLFDGQLYGGRAALVSHLGTEVRLRWNNSGAVVYFTSWRATIE